MVYGYIRVSTDKQTVENQRFEIQKYVETRNLKIDQWFEDTISGTVAPNKRNLGKLIPKLQKGDILICSELSRLGRSMFMIMSILNFMMEREVHIYTVKENYKLGDDISSKVLAFAFSLSAEIERNLISQRTLEALKRKKSEGVRLGRPKGKAKHYKLTDYEDEIREMLAMGIPKTQIFKQLGVSSQTLYNFLNQCDWYKK